MITTYIVNLVLGLFIWLFSFLPTAVLPVAVTDLLDIVGSTLSFLALIIPVDEALTVIKLILVIELGILAYKAANEIINKLRGAGG